jgi:hypothetical protein
LAVALVCWLLFVLLTLVLPDEADLRRDLWLTGWATFLPLTLLYLIALFAYGFDGASLEARDSGFSARLFTLPVETWALVGWPMLHGAVAIAVTWVAWAGFVLRPNGFDVPLWWPALLLAAVLTWLQAVLWSPFRLPFLRIGAALAVPAVLGTAAGAGVIYTVSQPVLAALFACLIPAAYLTAAAGVCRARHGGSATGPRQAQVRPAAVSAPARSAFASPARAQLWFEMRCHGFAFPLLLGCLLVFQTGGARLLARLGEVVPPGELFPVLNHFSRETGRTFLVFHPLVILPPLIAALIGIGLGALGPKFRPSSFLLTRPLDSGALVLAKFRAGALSTLAALALTIAAGLAWLALTGTAADVATWWRQVVETYGPERAWAMPALAVVAFAGLTWLHLCKNVPVGLLGSPWPQAIVPSGAVALVALGLLAQWLYHDPAARTQLGPVLPWLLAFAVLLKGLAAGGALLRVGRRRLWPARVPAVLVGVWMLTAGCTFTFLAWLVPAGLSLSLLAAGVVLALPLARLLAAPLALEWGRRG